MYCSTLYVKLNLIMNLVYLTVQVEPGAPYIPVPQCALYVQVEPAVLYKPKLYCTRYVQIEPAVLYKPILYCTLYVQQNLTNDYEPVVLYVPIPVLCSYTVQVEPDFEPAVPIYHQFSSSLLASKVCKYLSLMFQ